MMNEKVYICCASLPPEYLGKDVKRKDRERKLSEIGRQLVFFMTEKRYGWKASETDVSLGADGKPYYGAHPDIHFNISHSGRWAAAVLAEQAVGLDIQTVNETVRWKAVAERSFAPSMQRRLEGSPDPKQEFYHLWTELEAYGKYLGCGLIPVLKQEAKEGRPLRIPFPDPSVACCIWTERLAEYSWIEAAKGACER